MHNEMETFDQIEELFKYHKLDSDQERRTASIRLRAKDLAHEALKLLPPGGPRKHCIHLMKDFTMWCITAISLESKTQNSQTVYSGPGDVRTVTGDAMPHRSSTECRPANHQYSQINTAPIVGSIEGQRAVGYPSPRLFCKKCGTTKQL